MSAIQNYNRHLAITGIIIFLVVIFSRCIHSPTGVTGGPDPRGNKYAGPVSCRQCHKKISDTYSHTAHIMTSGRIDSLPRRILLRDPLLRDPLLQDPLLHKAGPLFRYNDSTAIAIENRDSGTCQVAFINGKETEAHPVAIAFGSGEKAQTYGYWAGTTLLELPLSYFVSIPGWANSPGFPNDHFYFKRPILSRCFECHGSYIEKQDIAAGGLRVEEALDKNSILYGIDCERCHGPATDHVNYHLQHPGEKKARYIADYNALTREQKLDACAVCHSGNDQATQRSTFAFRPGDTLSHFYYPQLTTNGSSPNPDVHGKQTQLLASSKCFIKANTLDCVTCHNTHANERGNLALYSQKCMDCHRSIEPPGEQPGDHLWKHPDLKTKALNAVMLANNCIDCHMPKQPSRAITFRVSGQIQTTPYLLRTHRIAVYPMESEKWLDSVKTDLTRKK